MCLGYADIAHYLYAGDTALHMAAAAFRRRVAKLLIEHGAHCRAKNRRGAEPLHYAADANRWDPAAQAETIEFLLSAGADPNAVDRSGVAPLHRAVRTRSPAAVRALLDRGAGVRQPNKSGSTPLHLAVQTTGRGGSGSSQARDQQALIIRLLLERGARKTDRDGRGRDVHQAATSAGRELYCRKQAARDIDFGRSRSFDHEGPEDRCRFRTSRHSLARRTAWDAGTVGKVAA